MDELTTLKDAKKYLRKNFVNGVDCPCCGHFTKVYKRRINSTIARALIELNRGTKPGEYVKINDWLQGRNVNPADVTKLALWEMLEAKEGIRDDGSKRIGFWRLTDKGREFAKGEYKTEKFVFEFRNKVLNKSNERVSIRECLGKKFNYDEIMNYGKY